MSTESAPRSRPGRPPRGGSPEAAAADRERRRTEYVDLRRRLGMSPAALAGLLGLSVGTIRLYPGWTLKQAPTDVTLRKMRLELVRLTRQRLEDLQTRREIERQLLEDECREHLVYCGVIDPDADEAEAA